MINVDIEASSRYPIRRKKIKAKIAEVLEKIKLTKNIEIEVKIVGDRKMKGLKQRFFKKDETTDVLSFPLHEIVSSQVAGSKIKISKTKFVDFPDNITRLGSIVISYPQAQKQANLHKLLIDEEINQLVEHGMWHLLGVHHE